MRLSSIEYLSSRIAPDARAVSVDPGDSCCFVSVRQTLAISSTLGGVRGLTRFVSRHWVAGLKRRSFFRILLGFQLRLQNLAYAIERVLRNPPLLKCVLGSQ